MTTSNRPNGTDGRARFDASGAPCTCSECVRTRTDANDPLGRALRAYASGDYAAVNAIVAEARGTRADSEALSELEMRAHIDSQNKPKAKRAARTDGDTEAAAIAAMNERIGGHRRTRH